MAGGLHWRVMATADVSPVTVGSDRRPRPALFVAALIAAGAGCAAVAAGGGSAGVVAGSSLVVLVGLPGLWRLRRDGLDAVGLYTAMTAVSFGAMSLLWLDTPAIPAPGIGQDEIASALLIVALGLAAFLLGARAVGPARARARLRFEASTGPRPLLLVALFAIAAGITALGIASSVIGYKATTQVSIATGSTQIFAQAASLGATLVLVCALQAFGGDDRRARRLLPWLLAGQFVVGFVAGFKGQSLIPVVYTGLAYFACTQRIPRRSLAVAVVATLGLLLPANFVYRAALRGGATAGPQAVFAEAEQFLAVRFRLIDHLALINARTPSLYAYGDGKRYLDLPAFVVVPRALWRGKPVLDDGLRFSQTYWEIPPIVRTSTPLTQVGDLLRNFGLAGVAVGMAIWGLVVGGFLALCGRLRSPRVEMIYVVSLVSWVTYVESDLPTLVASASRSMLVTVAVAWLLLPGRSQPAGYRVLLERGSRTLKTLRRAG